MTALMILGVLGWFAAGVLWWESGRRIDLRITQEETAWQAEYGDDENVPDSPEGLDRYL